MTRRAVAFAIFAVLVAAGCVRLGFWQLHRLAERRALNARLTARLTAAPASVGDLLRDSATATYRRATATGTYDFANEAAIAARTHEGSPGVNLLTPLRVAGSDTAVLVNRGWVYAPDAMTVDFARWLEPSAATVSGYLVDIPAQTQSGPVTASTNARVIRRIEYDSLAKRFPYPIAPFILVMTGDSAPANAARRDSTPARLPPPLMDEGPHLGYAVQWFSFAVIALVGGVVAARTDRRGNHRAGRPIVRTVHPRGTPHG